MCLCVVCVCVCVYVYAELGKASAEKPACVMW